MTHHAPPDLRAHSDAPALRQGALGRDGCDARQQLRVGVVDDLFPPAALDLARKTLGSPLDTRQACALSLEVDYHAGYCSWDPFRHLWVRVGEGIKRSTLDLDEKELTERYAAASLLLFGRSKRMDYIVSAIYSISKDRDERIGVEALITRNGLIVISGSACTTMHDLGAQRIARAVIPNGLSGHERITAIGELKMIINAVVRAQRAQLPKSVVAPEPREIMLLP